MNISINKVTNRDISNIEALKRRQRGDLYYSDDKGFLKKMTLFQKIILVVSKIFNTNYFDDNQTKVNGVISDLVSRIESGDKNELSFIFFEKLVSLSEKIYNRSKINSKILTVFRNMFMDDKDYKSLCKKQEASQRNILGISIIRSDQKTRFQNIEQMKKMVLESLLATHLGVRAAKPDMGNSKTYFIRDINGKIIGVFKPSWGDSLSLNSPFFLIRWRNVLLSKFNFLASIYKYIAGNCHIAEVASYEMNEGITTNVVPPTTFVTLNPDRWKSKITFSSNGSLQMFLPDMEMAKKFLGVYLKYRPATRYSEKNKPHLSDELFEKLIINDVVTGNLDRHAENWLIEVEKNNSSKAKNIILIDGGMAFSPTHPANFFERKQQYLWATKSFEWSKGKFSKKSKDLIKDINKKRFELRKQLVDLYIEQKDDPKVANARGDRMVERIEMLYYFAIIKDMKKYQLSHYRTQEEMDKLKEIIRKESR